MYLTGGESKNLTHGSCKRIITWSEDIDKPELGECKVQKRHGFSICLHDVLSMLFEDLLTIG